jgi:hypothetical protein
MFNKIKRIFKGGDQEYLLALAENVKKDSNDFFCNRIDFILALEASYDYKIELINYACMADIFDECDEKFAAKKELKKRGYDIK